MDEYYVAPNTCSCHPETCACKDWAIIGPDGNKFTSAFSKFKAQMIADGLNLSLKMNRDAGISDNVQSGK